MTRNVIISGAASGIGQAIANKFNDLGDRIFVFDINTEGAQETVKNFNEGYAYEIDITDEDMVSEAVAEVTDNYGDIDILVNNAGIQHISTIENFKLSDWNKVIDIILNGTFLLTKHVLPSMKKLDKGRVITISSIHGIMADPNKSAYISAKFGQIGFAKAVAVEHIDDGITSNAVLPGPVRTTLVEKQIKDLAEEDGTSEEEALKNHFTNLTPAGRLMEPEEIAGTVAFLASDAAEGINGQAINISGGTGMTPNPNLKG